MTAYLGANLHHTDKRLQQSGPAVPRPRPTVTPTLGHATQPRSMGGGRRRRSLHQYSDRGRSHPDSGPAPPLRRSGAGRGLPSGGGERRGRAAAGPASASRPSRAPPPASRASRLMTRQRRRDQGARHDPSALSPAAPDGSEARAWVGGAVGKRGTSPASRSRPRWVRADSRCPQRPLQIGFTGARHRTRSACARPLCVQPPPPPVGAIPGRTAAAGAVVAGCLCPTSWPGPELCLSLACGSQP